MGRKAKYSKELKLEIAKRYLKGESASALANEYGMFKSMEKNIMNLGKMVFLIQEDVLLLKSLWNQLIKRLDFGDTLVFDSVSRMSRNSEEGFKDYKMLYDKGIKLIFLNEPLINSEVFD
ncbi:MAG: hypothetical protein IJS83_02480 [Acholeplasmatales bacterium]|nr:hypothetical protein [Acholeplasmatales bacterium]